MAFLLCFSNADSSCSSCEYTRLVLIVSLTRKYTEWLGRTCRSHQRRYEAFCATFACAVHCETGDWHERPEGQILHLDENHASSSLRRTKSASLQSVRHVYLKAFTERPVNRVIFLTGLPHHEMDASASGNGRSAAGPYASSLYNFSKRPALRYLSFSPILTPRVRSALARLYSEPPAVRQRYPSSYLIQ